MKLKEFDRAMPEALGLPSSCIDNFKKRLYDKEVPMHSVLMMYRNRLIHEYYYHPCTADTLHRMFSISKSFTSVATGLLIDEGKITLDDRIADFFPEYATAGYAVCDSSVCSGLGGFHPYIEAMTIKDMLMMRTCHEKTTYKLNMAKNWVESFFTTVPTHPSGTVFHYDTSAAHVLSALVEKLTGMELLEYIKFRLPDLGLSSESYMLRDPFDVSMGGSGLVATSMDMLKFGYFLYNEGRIGGKQLLSSSYIRNAVSCLTPTRPTAPVPSEASGYGFMFWRTQKGGYVAYGMGGQLIIVHPDLEFICVTTADTQGIAGGNQAIYDALYEEIFPYLGMSAACEADSSKKTAASSKKTGPSPESDPAQKSGQSHAPGFSVFIPPGAIDSTLEPEISGMLYRSCDPSGLFDNISLTFSENEGCFSFTFAGDSCEIKFGKLSQVSGSLPLYGFFCCASGCWLDKDTFYIKVNVIDSSVGSIHLQFHFRDDSVVLYMRKQEESLLNEFSGHITATLAAQKKG